MTGRGRRGRAAGLAVLLILLLAAAATFAPSARADEAAGGAEAALESALQEDRSLVWLMGLLRFGTALVGMWLVVRGYATWSRRRAGLLPPVPPPRSATTIAPLPVALALLLIYALLPSFLRLAVVDREPAWSASMGLTVVVMVAVAIPIVAALLRRRRDLVGEGSLAPASVLKGGFLAFCIGNALAVPALFIGAAVLKSMGEEVTTYQVVENAVDPAHPANLWITAFLAVVVAPVVEETLFRGALYPAVRDAAGGGRRGIWAGAILVSALFAAFHGHAPSFLPLFFLALVFTWVFERTDSLATVVVAHALFNAASVVPLLVARAKGIL